jgi:outer membrane protein OmpA-like peptidoglycan-associated protein/DNA-binding XRE family transcriptional regulator
MTRPGRPEQPLDSSGPLAEFARELRQIRRNAGLTYAELAAKTSLSAATLRAAAGSKQLPTWSTTCAFIAACDGDEGAVRALYNDACQAAGRTVPGPPPARPPVPVPGELTSAAQFVAMLKRLRVWADTPSLAELSKLGGGHLPTSTVSDMLNNDRLPRLDLTQAFVRACGLDDDQADAWEVAWADIRSRPKQPAPPDQEPSGQWARPGWRTRRGQHAILILCLILLCLIGLLGTIIGLGVTGHIHLGSREPAGPPERFIIVPSATANEPAPVLSAAMLQQLWSAGLNRATKATAYVVTPGNWRADTLPLTSYSLNTAEREATLRANLARVQQAVERQATKAPFDLLADILAAVKAVPRPATLIVISSGVTTAGAFDLRRVGWGASPGAVASNLERHGLLPDLAGYKVVFSGLGNTSGDQPALPLPQQATLVSYWMAICQAARAASCTTDESTRPEPHSRSTTPVPVVPVPSVTTVTGPHHSTATTLPNTLLFTSNSATLIPGADSALQLIAQEAQAQGDLVAITGYASPDSGTPAYNLALSTRRADAVRDRLIALGLSPGQITRVTGAGAAGYSRSACLVHGKFDEARCALLRHVVITLTPPKGFSQETPRRG